MQSFHFEHDFTLSIVSLAISYIAAGFHRLSKVLDSVEGIVIEDGYYTYQDDTNPLTLLPFSGPLTFCPNSSFCLLLLNLVPLYGVLFMVGRKNSHCQHSRNTNLILYKRQCFFVHREGGCNDNLLILQDNYKQQTAMFQEKKWRVSTGGDLFFFG